MRHDSPGGIGFEAEAENRIYSILHIAEVEIPIISLRPSLRKISKFYWYYVKSSPVREILRQHLDS